MDAFAGPEEEGLRIWSVWFGGVDCCDATRVREVAEATPGVGGGARVNLKNEWTSDAVGTGFPGGDG